jgi:TolB-like protein/AraC-like DNA-binding protein
MDEPLSLDQAFIKKLTDIVLANLRNEQFGVEEFSSLMGMSHSTIHRKLRLYTNRSLSQFIRDVRLQKAHEMLQQNLGTICDISFRVGFGSPAYFDKCFHEYFGYPPGDVRKRILQERADQDETHIESLPATGLLMPVKENDSSGWKLSARKMVILTAFGFVFIAAITIFWISFSGSHRKSSDLSIIVLPFKNLSDDPGNQYFADALMEDILNSLFQISELKVISRTTSEHFRGTSNTSREIAKEVNVHYVLEGTIRRQGDMVRVNIQLIDAFQDRHVWSEIFDRKVTDIFDIQYGIALNVALKLNIVLSEEEKRRINPKAALRP